jgi:hypothetical protein
MGLDMYLAARNRFTYDANGNLINDGTNTYTRDERLTRRSGKLRLRPIWTERRQDCQRCYHTVSIRWQSSCSGNSAWGW